jgi:exodeoxyribonuclease VII large subunit
MIASRETMKQHGGCMSRAIAVSHVGTWTLPRLPALVERLGLPLLLIYTGFLSCYGLNQGEFYRNESLRAIVARDMLRTGNWVVPTLYGEPLLTKPPGMYVAIALCSLPFRDVSEWTARLPSTLAALGCVLLFYGYFRKHLGQRAGLIAGCCLPLSLMWLDKAPAAEIDMVQVFWVTAAIILFVHAVEMTTDVSSGRLRTGLVIAAFLCLTAGVLTKWTAPLFFYLTIVPLLWWRGQVRYLWCRYHLAGVLVAAILCLSWAAAAGMLAGWDVFYTTVSREALLRISPSHHPRAYPWTETLAHPARVVIAALPISLFMLPALRPAFMKRLDAGGRSVCQLLHCWAWPSLLFWTLTPGHAIRNSLPLYPALAGFAALWFVSRARSDLIDHFARGERVTSVPRCSVSPGDARPSLAILLAVAGCWLVVKIVFIHAVVPARLAGRDARAKGEHIAAHVPANAVLYLFQVKDEGVMFYYGRDVRRLRSLEQLPSTTKPLYCILNGAEWRAWQQPVDWSLEMTDAQGDPLILVRLPATGERRVANLSAPMSVPENIKILSISELTQAIKGLLEEGFPHVWVSGEISNLSRPASGHIYLTLKDAGAQLRGVIWRSTLRRVRFEPRDGMKVIACGRLSVYEARGEYQLAIDQIHEKGLGERERRLRELKEKLFRLGYFTPERKKPLPAFPRRVALVTSPSGAAVRDMLEILSQRWPAVDVIVCPVRVQGEGAAADIAAGVRLVNAVSRQGSLPIDVMIVGRGGGSLEDLWPFNEECVAHAIFHSVIPVVSAVGHEIDLTLADLVADRRALTPSEAATAVVPSRAEHREVLDGTRNRMGTLLAHRLAKIRQRLDELTARRIFRQPLERIRDEERKLDDWSARLARGMQQRLDRARTQLSAQSARLEALSPLNVLARGYSLTCKEADQALVRTAEQVQPGDRLVTRVQRGRIVSRVEELQADSSPDVP